MNLIKILIVLTILLSSFNISLASAPIIAEHELIYRQDIEIQTRNLLNKSVNEDITIFYGEDLINCQIKRYNDFYGMRQFRCFVPCVPFIESEAGDCYRLDDREDNYFIVSVNLENPNIINAQFHQGQYSYYIETENSEGEKLEVRDDAKVYDDYIYYFSKNKNTAKVANQTLIDEELINDFNNDIVGGLSEDQVSKNKDAIIATNQALIDEELINDFDNDAVEELSEGQGRKDLRFFYIIISALALILAVAIYKKGKK